MFAEVGRRGDAPVLEHHAREHAVALQREIAARLGELAAGDVAALGEAGLAEFEGGEDEQVRGLVETRLAQPDAVHYAITKRQFGHLHNLV